MSPCVFMNLANTRRCPMNLIYNLVCTRKFSVDDESYHDGLRTALPLAKRPDKPNSVSGHYSESELSFHVEQY